LKIKLNQIELSYTDVGSGMPLLLIHGYPLSRQMWFLQLDPFAKFARILAPDLRGYGDSTPTPGPYSMDLFAADLADFLDELNIIDPITLCGLSMGGYIAMAFARNYPNRLGKLVLVSTRAAPDSPEGRQGRDRAAHSVRENGIQEIINTMTPKLLSPQNLEKNPHLMTRAKEIMKPSLEGVIGSLAGMRDRVDARPFLAKIMVPTLIIHGADDQLIPVAEAEAMSAAIPGSHLFVIPGAGHLPNLEQPDLFNLKMRDFVFE
jgi:3-oxoadipate enol-lactonase